MVCVGCLACLLVSATAVVLLLRFLKTYVKGGVCTSNARLNGKTVIITGATAGIGKETARDLARRGARIILAVRNLDKVKDVIKEISEQTSNKNIQAMKLDLSSFQSVVNFANEIKKSENKIDILINNAGAYIDTRTVTEDGLETTFQANYLSHFLLTMLLLDILKNSAPSRIINVSSRAYTLVPKGFDLNSENSYNFMTVYAHSKLAQILLTRKMDRMLKGTGVSVFSLHPGVVETNFIHIDESTPLFNRILLSVVALVRGFLGKTCKQGAQTTIHCAVFEGLEELSGSYFSDCHVEKLQPQALDDAAAEKLFEESVKMVNQYLK